MSDDIKTTIPGLAGLKIAFEQEPSASRVVLESAQAFGSKLKEGPPVETKLIIVGSGPAGLTAAIYAARDNLAPIVLGGSEPGGQLMITDIVENYPGFPDGVSGPDLIELFRAQATRFGARLLDVDVDRVDLSGRPLRLWAAGVEYRTEALIVATGASALWLGMESETRLRGHGVSACATCDGFFFRDKEVAVVGGGDTALEEALFLTRFARKVHLIVRRDAFRGSKIMVDRARQHPKIELHMNREIEEILGADSVSGVRLRSTADAGAEALGLDGVFVAIGHRPNAAVFADALKLDNRGYLALEGEGTASAIPGVFIAGDVDDSRYRQAVTAAGEGARAAIDAERWLEGQNA